MLHANLIIKPLSAKIFYETSVLFKMDPFVRVKVGNQILNSPTCSMGGKTPTWTNVEMPIRADDVLFIRFELWDRNKLTDDELIGYGDLEFSKFVENKFFEWIPLKRDGVIAAELLSEITIIPDKENVLLTSHNIQQNLENMVGPSNLTGIKNVSPIQEMPLKNEVSADVNLEDKIESPHYAGEGYGGMQSGMMQDNAGLKEQGEK